MRVYRAAGSISQTLPPTIHVLPFVALWIGQKENVDHGTVDLGHWCVCVGGGGVTPPHPPFCELRFV